MELLDHMGPGQDNTGAGRDVQATPGVGGADRQLLSCDIRHHDDRGVRGRPCRRCRIRGNGPAEGQRDHRCDMGACQGGNLAGRQHASPHRGNPQRLQRGCAGATTCRPDRLLAAQRQPHRGGRGGHDGRADRRPSVIEEGGTRPPAWGPPGRVTDDGEGPGVRVLARNYVRHCEDERQLRHMRHSRTESAVDRGGAASNTDLPVRADMQRLLRPGGNPLPGHGRPVHGMG